MVNNPYFWVIPVFIPNEILVFVGNLILVSLNWKQNWFRIVVWGGWRMSIWSSAKIKPREPERLKAEPFDFTTWMQYELLSGTKLIPEYKSFRYHITAPKKQALLSFAFNCSRCFKDDSTQSNHHSYNQQTSVQFLPNTETICVWNLECSTSMKLA